MIFCRRATSEDAELFKKIRLRALADSPDAFGTTLEDALDRDAESWKQQIVSTASGDLRNTQFAFEGDECIGIAALYREPEADSGNIIMMWVDPKFRGSEAASELVGELIRWAIEIGLSSVALSVTDTNTRAITFYENMNFWRTEGVVEIDRRRNLFGMRMLYSLD